MAFIVFACDSLRKDSILTAENSEYNITYSIDSISIGLKDLLKHDYPYASNYEGEEEIFFMGYNENTHKLDAFDLNEKNHLFSITLERDGPNGLGEPWDFYIHNLDSIFYLSKNNQLGILDRHGAILKKINLARINSDIGFKAHPIYFKIKYDKSSKRVYFNSYSYQYLPNQSQYYEEPFIAYYSFSDNLIYQLPLKFTDSYKKISGYLGEYFEPNVIVQNDSIIYSFPAESDIYFFNLRNEKSLQFSVKSKTVHDKVPPLPSETYRDINARLIHLIENPYFYPLIPDPHRNLFYRLHTAGIPYSFDGISYNYMSDKNEYLTVFDKDMNIIEELELPFKTYNTNSMFVTKEGLIFPFSHFQNPQIDEEKLQFHIYKFQVFN